MMRRNAREQIFTKPMEISPREIAFDIDGVVADTFRLFVKRARKEYGYRFTYEDIIEYDFLKVIDIDKRISDKLIRDLLENPLETGIRPIPGAVEFLSRLSQRVPLLFVTARPRKEPILEWLCKHLPLVKRDLIHIEATTTHQEKLPILLQKRIKYFVDDYLKTCFLLEGTPIKPIVFEQPWNRKIHPFPVVKGWADIASMISW